VCNARQRVKAKKAKAVNAATKFATFAEYASHLSPAQRRILRRVRAAIRRAAPRAEESIRYNMPSFRGKDGALLHYAAFARHIGLFPPLRGNPKLQEAAARYAGPKGNLRFAYGAVPFDLIQSIAAWRLGGGRDTN
jgi:uncharacterized protein YdhG (YjbR/CyaY superfamily)